LAEILTAPPRCQLVLTFDVTRNFGDDRLIKLVKATDMAALILYDGEGDDMRLQQRASGLVTAIQKQGLAVMIAGDERIAVRIGADGIHSEETTRWVESKNTMMRGHGHIKDRHQAMELGETGADYLMFGKLGADKQAEPHSRNLRLATWWAALMEIPCIVQAGTDIEAMSSAVEMGAEFIAIEEMIFSKADGCATLVKLRQLLDEYAASKHNDG